MIVSVIVPTYNRAPQVKRMLDTLLQDDYPEIEIIVCDGGSTDGTVDLLESYGDQIIWISEPDKGEYDARNKGLRLANGDLIKYMSDDDVLMFGIFEYGVEYFRQNPDVDILFGQSVWFDERGGTQSLVSDNRFRGTDSITLRNFIRSNYPQPNSESVFFRREVLEKIGYFNINLIGADYEYWARAASADLEIAICDQVFVHYHLSDMSGVERKYFKLVYERWQIASRYGDWKDKIYTIFVFIPYRSLAKFIRELPIIGKPLRIWWNRKKAENTIT